jgi:hypothetical protein
MGAGLGSGGDMFAAYDYPILGVFWTMLLFFAFFIWIWLLITVFADIFRSHDIHGFAKAMWTLFVIFLPLLGVLIYLIARGHGMAERNIERQVRQQQEFDAYVRQVASQPSGIVSAPDGTNDTGAG